MTALLLLAVLGTACGSPDTKEADRYAIVTKSEGNRYNDSIVEGFRSVVEAAGNECVELQPKSADSEAQIVQIERAIAQDIRALAVAATDADALTSSLKKATDAGIKVLTFDSNVQGEDRITFVNQASADAVGKVLMEAVHDIGGGTGQWAILSTTSRAANQDAWITAMKKEAENKVYEDLMLVDIAFGEDNTARSKACVEQLLADYPDLKVICAPTVMGIRAAVEVVRETKSQVRVTGLGLPSEMADYMETGGECPYMYLWNPKEIGRLTAYTAIALASEETAGMAGETFRAGDMGTYTFKDCADGGSEIIVGEPLRIDETNIRIWKEIF